MQDVNGNGEPDDEWYELRGSETGKEGTVSGYAVTYYRPAGKGMDVQWTDSEGHSGTIEYKGEFHDQDFYYPAWAADTYTLRGTLLESRNMVDDRGFWINRPYDWGYADNYGSDCLAGGDAVDGKGQSNGFRIANAMQPRRNACRTEVHHFVKVQVGSMPRAVRWARFRPKFSRSPTFRSWSKAAGRIRRITSLFRLEGDFRKYRQREILYEKRSSRERKSFPGASLVAAVPGVFGFRLPLKASGETA